jgi:predicted ATP-binding protein involved in virulence
MNDISMRSLINNAKNGHLPSLFLLSKFEGEEFSQSYFKEVVDFLNDPFEFKFYLESINVLNYKKITELSLNFDKKLTVIIGENGAGKTSILEGIFKNISVIINNIIKIDVNGLLLTDGEVNNSINYTAEVGVENYCEFSCNFSYGNNSKLEGSLVKKAKGSNSKKKSKYDDYKMYGAIWREVNSIQTVNLPLFSYYGVDRISFDKKKNNERNFNNLSRFDAYNLSMSGSSSFNDLLKWLIHSIKKKTGADDYIKLHNQIIALKGMSLDENDVLNKILKNKINEYEALSFSEKNDDSVEIIEKLFKEIYPEFKEIILDMSSGNDEILLDFGSRKVNIKQLSDGQRVYLGLIADIAYKLILLNPHLANPLHGHGIVLIDEVELHLHPKWQQQSIINLQKIFPYVQFIITTHSPHVLSTVDKNSIKILTDNSVVQSPILQTKGVISSDVLERIMGTSATPPVREAFLLQDLSNLIDQNEYESLEAERKYNELVEHFGDNHPEIFKIKSKIELMKLKSQFKKGISK